MGKAKYQFNTQSLRIEKVDTSLKSKILYILYVTVSGLAFALVLVFLLYSFFDSPKEKMQQRELEQMTLQYEILMDRLNKFEIALADLQEQDDDIYRTIFEAEPIPASVRNAGFGGANRYDKLKGYKNSEIIIEATKKMDLIHGKIVVQSKSFEEVFELVKNKESMLASIPAIQPLSNKNLKRISSYFGHRTDPIYKVTKFHRGIDFSAPTGTPIYATGDATVKSIKRSRRGYGNVLILDHGYNYTTLYAHLSKFAVRKGQKVKRGEIVAYVGNSGKSTAPHLHYEVRKNDQHLNPIYYFFNDLSPEEFDEVVTNSQKPGQSFD